MFSFSTCILSKIHIFIPEYFGKEEIASNDDKTTKTKEPNPSGAIPPNIYFIPPPPPPTEPNTRHQNISLNSSNVLNKDDMTKAGPSKPAQNFVTEFPRIATQQASLPVELQHLSTEQVYPNQETSVTLEKKRLQEKIATSTSCEPNCQVTSKEDGVKKRIVWNTNAPSNPFPTHCYTKEPGAWYVPFMSVFTCI